MTSNILFSLYTYRQIMLVGFVQCNETLFKKNLANSFIHKIPMCDYYSNYRTCRPQLAHCFSSVSFLINEALVITGLRGGFKALTSPHSKLLTPSMSWNLLYRPYLSLYYQECVAFFAKVFLFVFCTHFHYSMSWPRSHYVS